MHQLCMGATHMLGAVSRLPLRAGWELHITSSGQKVACAAQDFFETRLLSMDTDFRVLSADYLGGLPGIDIAQVWRIPATDRPHAAQACRWPRLVMSSPRLCSISWMPQVAALSSVAWAGAGWSCLPHTPGQCAAPPQGHTAGQLRSWCLLIPRPTCLQCCACLMPACFVCCGCLGSRGVKLPEELITEAG